jgi:hypothetical protein
MKETKKLLGIAFLCLFAWGYSACDNPVNEPRAVDAARGITRQEDMDEPFDYVITGIEKVSQELFGDVKIGSEEFLFNLDESPDFIYVDFTNSGYAVFAAESFELLEYAAQGSLPYQNTRARRYYGGPTNYFNKENEKFVNTVTKESVHVTSVEAETYSRRIVDISL